MTRRIPDRATLRAALRESSVTEWYAVHYEHLRECGPVEAACVREIRQSASDFEQEVSRSEIADAIDGRGGE